MAGTFLYACEHKVDQYLGVAHILKMGIFCVGLKF